MEKRKKERKNSQQLEYLLSNLLNQRIRVGYNPRQELGRLLFLQRRKPLYARTCSKKFIHELPELPELGAMLCKAQGLIPPNDLASHRSHRSTGVGSRSLVEEIEGGLRRVEDYNLLPQDIQRHHIAYARNSIRTHSRQRARKRATNHTVYPTRRISPRRGWEASQIDSL